MSLINWNGSLNLGIESIDKQHQELVRIINALHDAMLAGKAKAVLGPILLELVNYTKQHFRHEEKLFRICAYAQTAAHSAQHASLTKQVLEFQTQFDAGATSLSIEVMEFLRDWLTKHIQETDKEYVSALSSHGIS